MKVLLIYAHPEPRSLNGGLKNFAIRHLLQAGHEVQVSDLYAMRWKAGYDADDSGAPPVGEFWRPTLDSRQAFAQGTQSADIAAEQEKLLWADTVIFQFPLWWFSMPAIMKGWIDRVYAWGFAYGVGEHSDRHWGDRYGEGTFVGKRAMLIVTAGGWAEHYSPARDQWPHRRHSVPHSARYAVLSRFRGASAAGVLPHGQNRCRAVRRPVRHPGRAAGHAVANRAHSIPPAESWRLSDPVANAAPGAGAGAKRPGGAPGNEINLNAIALPGYRFH
jgi:putative NADPH-quinone reductase